MKRYIESMLIILILTGFVPLAFAAGNSVTMLGALPTPVGVMNEIKLTPGVVAEGDLCTQAGKIGLDASHALWVCNGTNYIPLGSVWTQNGNNIYLTDTSNPGSKRVGIGTSTPAWKLTLENDGAILAKGTFGGGDVPVTAAAMNTGTRFMWIPRKAAIRAGYVSAAQWNNVNIGDYSVAFGNSTKAATNYSVIGGGLNNSINANGGDQFDGYAVISGGRTNSSSSNDTVIAGGNTNTIGTGAQYSVVSGGFTNVINNLVTGGTISGGWNNTVSGAADTIGGGWQNSVNGGLIGGASTIAGGYSNTISAGPSYASVISGGHTNTIVGPYNTVAGGNQNSLDTGGLVGWSTIGGGGLNVIGGVKPSRAYSTIAGGRQNSIDGQYSTIAGGNTNAIAADNASIIGGSTNTVSGNNSTIPGGENNTVNGANSVALGSEFTIDGNYSVGIGRGATIQGDGNFVVSNFDYLTDPYGPITTNNSAIFMITGGMGIGTSGVALDPASAGKKLAVAGDTEMVGDLKVTGDGLVEGTLEVASDTQIHGALMTDGDVTIGGSLKATLRSIDEIGMDTTNPVYYDFKNGTNEFGYDIAELFDAKEEIEIAELVEVSDDPGVQLQRTQTPYSKSVVGVVSTAAAIVFEGNELQIAPKPGEFTKGKKPPVALAGRVPVKVSNENGPIERGDLLVSSSVPGHAMKATDRDKMMGAVVGKALESFESGKDGEKTGVILMMVNLQ